MLGDRTACGGVDTGTDEHAASVPTMAAHAKTFNLEISTPMTLLLLEALGALGILVFIVWWTMFSGRDGGELRDSQLPQADEDAENKNK